MLRKKSLCPVGWLIEDFGTSQLNFMLVSHVVLRLKRIWPINPPINLAILTLDFERVYAQLWRYEMLSPKSGISHGSLQTTFFDFSRTWYFHKQARDWKTQENNHRNKMRWIVKVRKQYYGQAPKYFCLHILRFLQSSNLCVCFIPSS